MSDIIAFIGVGNMGNPMATNLHKAGYKIKVFDISTEMLIKAKENGLETVNNINELITEKVSIVITMLPEGKHSKQIYLGNNGIINKVSKDCLLIDCSTIDIETSKEIGKAADNQNIMMIDAPVSGGPKGAHQGNIAVMVGGTESQFAKIKPIMDDISSNIFYAGKIGSGHSIKAGNNLLNLICRMATFEVISLLVKDGVDPKKAVEIIQKSSGRNYATEITLPDNILSGKMVQGFSTGLMKKDAGVATKIADSNNVEIPLGKLSQELLKNTIDDFGENADMSNVALTYEKLTGAKIRP